MQTATADRHRGAYFNMHAALDEAQADVLLLLQDDVQVVRKITIEDVQDWRTYWYQHPDCAFMIPVFLKSCSRFDFRKYYQPNPKECVNHLVEDPQQPSKDGPAPRSYMDNCLLHVQHSRDGNWRYHTSEWLTGQKAPNIFLSAWPSLLTHGVSCSRRA